MLPICTRAVNQACTAQTMDEMFVAWRPGEALEAISTCELLPDDPMRIHFAEIPSGTHRRQQKPQSTRKCHVEQIPRDI